ncbi:toxin-antitoxin system YwqK family antitoxin [Glacieibacterium frigidum]|uniref:Uncharacterized protein n=1 Tax=Glacieibacterium frigidum TaxID=2593303 RepID=A0A552UJ32_9SPHN|nr:hypothetical protein [Glacieibacterium frigidum]TRW18248.1 hypothetical protein FMM06_09170 [Glacieibacterium frigidum]
MLTDEVQVARADYDDLEFDDDLALLNGVPFTGIVFSMHPNGRLEAETRYTDGLPDGLSEWFYPDGRLESRNIAVRGRGSSESWNWHPNGVLAEYRRDENQRPVELRKWNEQGVAR